MLADLETNLEQADAALEVIDEADLSPANTRAWRAWAELSGSRPVGFGVGAIPFGEIKARFELLGQRPDAGQVERIRVIDNEFLAHHAEERKKEEDKRPARHPAPGPQRRR